MRLIDRRFTRSAAGFVVAVLLAACSHSPAMVQRNGASPSMSSRSAIGTETITGIGTVLDARGSTLYHLTTETKGKIECTGSCALTWPPLDLAGKMPSLPPGLSGSLGTVERPDGGTQLTFDGMPLYTYSGDAGPGQANGQGIQGVWFAVTSSGSRGGSGSTSSGSSSSPGSGGYGY